MTKEELDKEAGESWWNDNNCSGALSTKKIYICGYLAGAKPREKRITELGELLNSTLEENKEIYKKMADLDTALEDCTESLTDARIKIKELEKENAELKDKLKNLESVAEVRLANWQKYEKENAELKRDKSELCNAINEEGKACVKLNEKLSKAKGFIEKLLIVSCNSEILIQYPNCKEVLEARVALEQFLMEK